MAKMIFVAEDHNLTSIQNIADAVNPQDAVAFHQLDEVTMALNEGAGISVTDGPLASTIATRVNLDGAIVNDTGTSKNELAIKPLPTGGIRTETNGVYLQKKKDGHVETDIDGTFVDMVALTRDPVFIDAVEEYSGGDVTGTPPITAEEQPDGTTAVGLSINYGLAVFNDELIAATDPNGGVMNNAGATKKELAVKKLGSGGLRSDTNGMFILKKTNGHVGTDNSGTFVDMIGLTNDPIFIAAVERYSGYTKVVGTPPVEVVNDGAGTFTVSVNTDDGVTVRNGNLVANVEDKGGLVNESGPLLNQLAIKNSPVGGLSSAVSGEFVLTKPLGHVGTDADGTFVKMDTLVADQIFIDAVEDLTTMDITGIPPILVADDGAGGVTVGLSTGPGTGVSGGNLIATVDPNGGLKNDSGATKALAVLYKPDSGIRTDTTGTFLHKKPLGHVATDNEGTFVDMVGLTTDQIFIDAVEQLAATSVVGVEPITVVDDGSGTSVIGLSHGSGLGVTQGLLIAAVDPNGGLKNDSGTSKELALRYKPDAGIRTDITGTFILKKPAGHVGTDNQGTFVDMNTLTTDPIFIDAVLDLSDISVTAVSPITAVDDGVGGVELGLDIGAGLAVQNDELIAAVTPTGGLLNTAGVSKLELAVLKQQGGGLRSDEFGMFILPKPDGGVDTDNQGVFVDWTVVPPPTGPTDAANKEYVDLMAQGISPLEAVRAATTGANIGLDWTTPVLDGVTFVDGDRVLVKDQTDPIENGVYIYSGIAAWLRAGDADEEGELKVGSTVFVSEGATLANSSWAVSDDGDPASGLWVPGTDITIWVKSSQITGYTGGDGIDVTGNIISVNEGPGLAIIGDEVRVITADQSINVSAGGIFVNVAPLSGLRKTSFGPMVYLDDDSGLFIDGKGILRAETGAGTVIGKIQTSSTVLDTQTLTVTHNLGIPNPTVSVQDANGCEVTVDICRPNDVDVQITFGKVPVATEFTVVVTG